MGFFQACQIAAALSWSLESAEASPSLNMKLLLLVYTYIFQWRHVTGFAIVLVQSLHSTASSVCENACEMRGVSWACHCFERMVRRVWRGGLL